MGPGAQRHGACVGSPAREGSGACLAAASLYAAVFCCLPAELPHNGVSRHASLWADLRFRRTDARARRKTYRGVGRIGRPSGPVHPWGGPGGRTGEQGLQNPAFQGSRADTGRQCGKTAPLATGNACFLRPATKHGNGPYAPQNASPRQAEDGKARSRPVVF